MDSLENCSYELTFRDFNAVGESVVFMGFSDECDCSSGSISIGILDQIMEEEEKEEEKG